MRQLAIREWLVLSYIIYHAAYHGITPTHREIMDGCGLSSTSVVATSLDALCAFGLIRMCQHKERTIVLQSGTVGVTP